MALKLSLWIKETSRGCSMQVDYLGKVGMEKAEAFSMGN
jgi:hypothetical protein